MKALEMRDRDGDLVRAVVRTKGRNRNRANKHDGWERDLWTAYLQDGPARMRAANEPPHEIA